MGLPDPQGSVPYSVSAYRATAGTVGVADAASMVGGPFTGIFNFCPTLMLSVFNPLAPRMAFADVPNLLAIRISVSPDLTVQVCSPLLVFSVTCAGVLGVATACEGP